MDSCSAGQPAAGQRDECVVEVGLLDAQVVRDDLLASQRRGDGVHEVAGAR